MEQLLILDRYRPLEELGEGGFAVVTLAWDTRMQRRVAIKRMPLPLDEYGRPCRPPGLAEARTAAMLNHPNIVSVFDFDADSDEAFLIMEYVEGMSLAELLDDVGGPLELDEAAAVIGDIAAALEYAHQNGVLHLDIKPENVMIGRDGRVKVTDFGIAELSTLAGHGPAYGGTPGFMPIEQIEGGKVTEATDEWAFAALAFEVLAGDNPFVAPTLEQSVMRIEVLDVPLPSEYEPSLTTEIDDVLIAGLGPYPADRYRSVSDFAEALLPLLGDPAEGRASLTDLIGAYDDEQPQDHDYERIGLWDRLSGRLGSVLGRLLAAVEAGWLAWAGLTPFGLERPALLAAVALAAAAGALAPSLGVALGLGCFVAGLAAAGSWVAAALVLLMGIAWWWLLARRSPGSAVLPLSAPVLGGIGVPTLQPLLAGFILPPLAAAAAGLLGGLLTILASAMSGSGAPYLHVAPAYVLNVWQAGLGTGGLRELATTPEALVALAGWPASAALMSLACSRATRLGAFVGTIGGTALLGASYLLADKLVTAGPRVSFTGQQLTVALAGSLILMTIVIALGAPQRAEEEPAELRRRTKRGTSET